MTIKPRKGLSYLKESQLSPVVDTNAASRLMGGVSLFVDDCWRSMIKCSSEIHCFFFDFASFGFLVVNRGALPTVS
jgi:hypothetical protein